MTLREATWIKLSGKTRHGKNRINQHGDKWLVMKVNNNAVLVRSFDKTEGPKDKKGFDNRWVQLNDDPNFEIKKEISDLEIELLKMDHMEIVTGRF